MTKNLCKYATDEMSSFNKVIINIGFHNTYLIYNKEKLKT